MSTEQPPPQPTDQPGDAPDIDRTASPDQGTPEHDEAMARLGEDYEGAVTQVEGTPPPETTPEQAPEAPPAEQEG